MIKEKVLLVYNPRAGNRQFVEYMDRVVGIFQKQKQQIIPIRLDRSSALSDAFKTAQRERVVKVIIAGGDGTVNNVVNTMLSNGVNLPIAIFPTGTANDFAHYYDIPTNIDRMIDVAKGDKYSYTDIGLVNGRYFVNVAALGFLVDVSQKTNPDTKTTLGVMSYYLKGMREIPNLKPITVRVESEEYSGVDKIYFMLVMNGKSAGGFKRVAPKASLKDGLLDVLIFREMPLVELPGLFFDVMQGQHSENKNVISFRTNSLRIDTDENIGTDIDGEKGCRFPLNITCVPKMLKINTPNENTEETNGKIHD